MSPSLKSIKNLLLMVIDVLAVAREARHGDHLLALLEGADDGTGPPVSDDNVGRRHLLGELAAVEEGLPRVVPGLVGGRPRLGEHLVPYRAVRNACVDRLKKAVEGELLGSDGDENQSDLLVDAAHVNGIRIDVEHALPLNVEAVGEAVHEKPRLGGRGHLGKRLYVDELPPEQLANEAQGHHGEHPRGHDRVGALPEEDAQGRKGVAQHAQREGALAPVHLLELVGREAGLNCIASTFGYDESLVLLHKRPEHHELLEVATGGCCEAYLMDRTSHQQAPSPENTTLTVSRMSLRSVSGPRSSMYLRSKSTMSLKVVSERPLVCQ